MNRTTIFLGIGGILAIVIYGLLDPWLFPFPKCPFRSVTGWMCPGCGSQRAVHQMLHGQFGQAFQLNALLIPAFIYALAGYGFSLFGGRYWPSIRRNWFGIYAAWVSLIIILAFWIGRNLW
ncbi:MAG TPA: DUF2752 domain-containing protein, partial [Saprospiraceae bacterium]|nr:DUF2752 domain-containing protein [Saprospiraceae bacterium]